MNPIEHSDPEVWQAIASERRRQQDRPGDDRLGELHQPGRPGRPGLGADQQVRRGLSRPALLRRLRVRRCRRTAGHRARAEAVRRRARQRAAALRRAGEHGRLLRLPGAGRHHPGDEPRPRRPSDARHAPQLLRQVLSSVVHYGVRKDDRAHRLRPGRRSWRASTSRS